MAKFYSLLFFIFIFTNSNGQLCFYDIDLNKIPQQEIKNLLDIQQKNKIFCISDIEATCSTEENLDNYFKQVRVYNLNQNIESVWMNYNEDSPDKVFNSRKLSFGLMLCKNKGNNKIIYNNGSFGKLEKGQVIYLKLKFLKGLYKMAVAFEILNVDSINKTIEFSYVKGGSNTNGKQKIQFIDCKNGKTKIIHTSYYRSNFILRDRILYPFFHAKVTNEFHKNIKHLILAKLKGVNQARTNS